MDAKNENNRFGFHMLLASLASFGPNKANEYTLRRSNSWYKSDLGALCMQMHFVAPKSVHSFVGSNDVLMLIYAYSQYSDFLVCTPWLSIVKSINEMGTQHWNGIDSTLIEITFKADSTSDRLFNFDSVSF